MMPINNKFTKLAGMAIACAVMSACSSDVSNPPPLNSGTPSSGDADFTTFVSIGDSLTAGYADGALYLLGQQNSFPLMLAQQFAAADGVAVSFEQPLLAHDLQAGVDGNLGALLVDTFGALIEARFVLNTETESPERLEGTATDNVVGTGLNGTAFNNMGVPGAKATHLDIAGFGNELGLPAAANPYFVRFATSGGASVIGDAAAQAPSFYTLWIGSNDVLGYATSGGDDSDLITDPVVFDTTYNGLVATMKGANAAIQGVLVNIADVSTIPFFTTVPYNAVPMTQADADAANAGYVTYNAGLQAAVGVAPGMTQEEADARTINFAEGQNALVILDETLTPIGGPETFLRQATADDLVLLPAASIIGTLNDPMDPASVIGVGFPLGDESVLIPSELEAIDAAKTAYNVTIKAAADNDPNLIFLDAAVLMKQLSESGISYGNGSINADFATGGAFSLDGVHPTARGYAVTANEIINVINTGFNANVHKVDPATFPTVFLK